MRAVARHPTFVAFVLVAVHRHRINITFATGALRLPRGYSPAQASQHIIVGGVPTGRSGQAGVGLPGRASPGNVSGVAHYPPPYVGRVR